MLELLDAGVDAKTKRSIEKIVEALVDGKELLGVRNVRGVKSGGECRSSSSWTGVSNLTPGQTHLDLTIAVPATMTVHSSHAVELRVREAIIKARRDIREVKIHVHGVQDGEVVDLTGVRGGSSGSAVGTDFGKEGC